MSADSHPQAQSAASAGGLLARVKAVFRLPNDDPRKTIAVALVLCLVCSVVVSATAVSLRPLQERNAARALKSEVVKVAGFDTADMSLDQAFEQIEQRLVDLETGEFVEDADPLSYSYRDAAKDPAASRALDEADPAGIQRRPTGCRSIWCAATASSRPSSCRSMAPGSGRPCTGCWRWRRDGRTAKALTFYEQRETAGLGSEVAGERWLSEWPGKVLIDETGESGDRGGEGQRRCRCAQRRAPRRWALRRHADQQWGHQPDALLARRAGLRALPGPARR